MSIVGCWSGLILFLVTVWWVEQSAAQVNLRNAPRGKTRYLALSMEGMLVQLQIAPMGEPFPTPFELALLRQDAVQKELEISSTDREKIVALADSWDSWKARALSALLARRDATTEDLQHHIRQCHDLEVRARELARAVIPASRARRFKEILFRAKLRYDGPLSSLTRGPLAVELGLDASGRRVLSRAAEAVAKEMSAKSAEIQKKVYESILNCLTEAQRENYRRLTGKLALGGAPHLEVLAMQLQKKSPLMIAGATDPLFGLRVRITYRIERSGELSPRVHVRQSAQGRLVLSLLRDDELMEQIGLLDDQIAALQDIAKDVRDFDRRVNAILTDARSRGDVAVEAARKQVGKMGKEFWRKAEREIAEILLPRQYRALEAAAQIRDLVQRGPVLAFQTPGLQRRLGITDAQMRRIERVSNRLARQIADQAAVLEQDALADLAESLPEGQRAQFLRQLGAPSRYGVAPVASMMADLVFDRTRIQSRDPPREE